MQQDLATHKIQFYVPCVDDDDDSRDKESVQILVSWPATRRMGSTVLSAECGAIGLHCSQRNEGERVCVCER